MHWIGILGETLSEIATDDGSLNFWARSYTPYAKAGALAISGY